MLEVNAKSKQDGCVCITLPMPPSYIMPNIKSLYLFWFKSYGYLTLTLKDDLDMSCPKYAALKNTHA